MRGHVHMSPGAIVIGSPKSSTSTLGTKPGPSERAISSAPMYVSGRGGTSHTTVTVTMRGQLCLRSQMSQISWGQEGQHQSGLTQDKQYPWGVERQRQFTADPVLDLCSKREVPHP